MAVEVPPTLPESIAECHALITALQGDLDRLRGQVDHLVRRLFGTKSERMDPNQLALFDVEEQAEPEPEIEAASDAAPRPKRKGHGRKPFPEDLPRKRVEHDVAPAEKCCPECGADKIRFGEDTSEQLEYVPASLYVIEHVRPKYACPHCQEHVSQATKPAQAIEKSTAGPGLIAHVLTSKYCDHCVPAKAVHVMRG